MRLPTILILVLIALLATMSGCSPKQHVCTSDVTANLGTAVTIAPEVATVAVVSGSEFQFGHKCPMCKRPGIYTGKTQMINLVTYYQIKCTKDHIWWAKTPN